jgi:hypothetical protein
MGRVVRILYCARVRAVPAASCWHWLSAFSLQHASSTRLRARLLKRHRWQLSQGAAVVLAHPAQRLPTLRNDSVIGTPISWRLACRVFVCRCPPSRIFPARRSDQQDHAVHHRTRLPELLECVRSCDQR